MNPAIMPLFPALPLVSIAVVNWNYERFVGECINSIKGQDYPRIEVVVMDNGSTDGSRKIIEECAGGDSRFRLVFLDKNIGQFNATMQCLDLLSGEFVCFIDSDDYLLDDYVSTHVQTHLALPFGVGLTSSNSFEISGSNDFLSGGRKEFHQVNPKKTDELRPLESRPPRVETISDDDYRKLSKLIHHRPYSTKGWLWSPGTANCFRRSVIDLVRPSSAVDIQVRVSTDNQLAQLCHWAAGTALINKCMSAYRYHGKNFFSSIPGISGLIGRNSGVAAEIPVVTYQQNLRIRILLDCHPKLAAAVGDRRIWEILKYAVGEKRREQKTTLQDAAVRDAFARALPSIIQTHEARTALKELRGIISHRTMLDIIRRADRNSLPKDLVRTLYLRGTHWTARSMVKTLKEKFRKHFPRRV